MTPIKPHLRQTLEIRVRYPECDAMGLLHHSRFLQYFEIGRVELLRGLGVSYAQLEARGVYFVVTKAVLNFRAPARYDELLQLTTAVTRQTTVRYDHAYQLHRDGVLLADGTTTIACVDKAGNVIPIPQDLC